MLYILTCIIRNILGWGVSVLRFWLYRVWLHIPVGRYQSYRGNCNLHTRPLWGQKQQVLLKICYLSTSLMTSYLFENIIICPCVLSCGVWNFYRGAVEDSSLLGCQHCVNWQFVAVVLKDYSLFVISVECISPWRFQYFWICVISWYIFRARAWKQSAKRMRKRLSHGPEMRRKTKMKKKREMMAVTVQQTCFCRLQVEICMLLHASLYSHSDSIL